MRTRRSMSMACASAALARDAPVAHDRLDDLVADRVGRVERGHRLLEDHRHAVAAQVPARAVALAAQIPAVEHDLALDIRLSGRQKAHDGERGHALAAAGFADDAEGAPARDGEADAVDGVRAPSVLAREGDLEIADIEQRFAHAAAFFLDSSSASAARIGDQALDLGAVDHAGGIFPRGHEFSKCRLALAADLLETRKLGERIRMVVDADVESGYSSSSWISKAADCLPRLSPPASSPAFSAASSRRGKGTRPDASKTSAVSRDDLRARRACCRRRRNVPRMVWPHHSTQPSPV